MPIAPSLPEVLESVVRHHLRGVHTSLPAKVLKFDPEANTVDVELATDDAIVDPKTKARSYEAHPALGGVPVIWPRGGGYVMTLPLAPGDFVWLMFSEQALGEWRTSGSRSRPVDARRHSIGYPYALPGAFPDVRALSTDDAPARGTKMVLGEDGGNCQVILDKEAATPVILLGREATEFVALASKVQTALDAIKDHTHASGAASPSTELAAGLGPVAATLVKAK